MLILDSMPRPESLLDRYDQMVRQDSEAIAVTTARVIEQGLGRSVRGERDYCVIILTGGDLVRRLRGQDSRRHFSDQMRTQIDIGIAAAELARQDVQSAAQTPLDALRAVAAQCLNRDDGWKEFYAQEMNKMERTKPAPKMLAIFADEDRAERLAQSGAVDRAMETVQAIIDTYVTNDVDLGWYLQEMARYRNSDSKDESNKLQLQAHKRNRSLLKPRDGFLVLTIVAVAQKRMSKIIEWVGKFTSYDDLNIAVLGIVENLRFGVDADAFEAALDELGMALGFETQRPDKEWGAGPDNLWAIRSGQYILWECKSEVLTTRQAIHKQEAGQMANASAWFRVTYADASVKRILVISTDVLGQGAGFGDPTEVMRAHELKALTNAVKAFFREFRTFDLKSLSEAAVQKLINLHRLSDNDLLARYTKKPKG